MRPNHVFPLRRLALALCLLAASAASAVAQGATEPPRGSPERRAIMDALRQAVAPSLKKPVIFEISHLRVRGSHAFLIGIPRKPDGTAFDYAGTEFQEAIDD